MKGLEHFSYEERLRAEICFAWVKIQNSFSVVFVFMVWLL